MIKIPAPSKELTMAKPHMPKLHKIGSKGFKPKVKMPKLGFKKFGKNA